jgi:hypothetical protein
MSKKCGWKWPNSYTKENFGTHPEHECGQDKGHENEIEGGWCICKDETCNEITFKD